jgi:hypothetical protein
MDLVEGNDRHLTERWRTGLGAGAEMEKRCFRNIYSHER